MFAIGEAMATDPALCQKAKRVLSELGMVDRVVKNRRDEGSNSDVMNAFSGLSM